MVIDLSFDFTSIKAKFKNSKIYKHILQYG